MSIISSGEARFSITALPWYTAEDMVHSNPGGFQASSVSADFQSLGVSLHSLGMRIGTGIHHCGGAIDILFLCGLRYWQGRGPKMRSTAFAHAY